MNYKKILIIENDNERDAENDYEKDFVDTYFKGLPVEFWYRFSRSLFDDDGKEKSMKRLSSVPEDTLLVTYTTFANSVMSGYGDLIGGWMKFFSKLPNKIHFCIMCMPELKWQILGWIGEGYAGKKGREKKLALLKDTLSKHNFISYPMSYRDDTPFEKEGTALNLKWLTDNYFEEESLVRYNGKKCRVGSFSDNLEEPKYSLLIDNGKGGWTLGHISIKDLKYNSKPWKVQN